VPSPKGGRDPVTNYRSTRKSNFELATAETFALLKAQTSAAAGVSLSKQTMHRAHDLAVETFRRGPADAVLVACCTFRGFDARESIAAQLGVPVVTSNQAALGAALRVLDPSLLVGRPEWVFVKVYTHGAPEQHATSLLGEGGRMMHAELTTRYNDGKNWCLHYVTAREMYNIAIAAMDGRSGDPAQYRDYVLPPPPAARA